MKIVHNHFKTTYSTNTWAWQNAQVLDKDAMTVVTADEQSVGRGRHQRKWVSPPGLNLYASFCLFVDLDLQSIANIPQVLALSCAELLKELSLTPSLKWPNDVLIDKKKVAGILCETKEIDGKRFVVTGIGLNINMTKEFFQEVDKPATSLLIESGKEYDPTSILNLLLEKFCNHLETYLEKGFSPFLETFKSYVSIDEGIKFSTDQHALSGKISQINADGSLTIQTHNGEEKTFYYGEIV
jgi:BirA family biotin operon repressor/biotin-[acetyl-CoA-carboxylase] ligase